MSRWGELLHRFARLGDAVPGHRRAWVEPSNPVTRAILGPARVAPNGGRATDDAIDQARPPDEAEVPAAPPARSREDAA